MEWQRAMNGLRILGITVAIIGVIVMLFGFNAADSPLDQLSETFTGRYTEKTMWYIIGGAAAIICGSLFALLSRKS